MRSESESRSEAAAILQPVGLVTLGLALGMLLCAAFGLGLDLLDAHRKSLDPGAWRSMLAAALFTGGCGVGAVWLGRGAVRPRKRRRTAVVVVALIWLCCGIFGALPYVLGAGTPPIDALFEAVSGFTTTGSTIMTDIEGGLSSPLLLWRSLTQWLGGMGIVVLFVAIFPSLGVGAKDMFRSEVPGPTAEGLRPRIAETSIKLWQLYTALTLAQVLIMWLLLGTDLFDAVCHAFTTLSTGGFSTYDRSIAAFDSAALEMVVALFMILSGVNFALYYAALRGKLRAALRSTELRVYLGLITLATLLLTIALLSVHQGLAESFRRAFFMVATTLTSTGYGTDDYMAYPPPALMLVVLMMLVGGSAGSTAGGIKVARVVIMLRLVVMQLRQTLRPSLVQTLRMGGQPVSSQVVLGVAAFCIVYASSLGLGTLLLTYTDPIPLPSAFGAMLTSLSNIGPAPWHVEADNFAGYSDAAKLLCSLAMIMGRLEFFTLLALLAPDVWRK